MSRLACALVLVVVVPSAISAPPDPAKPKQAIWSLALSPDGKTLVGGSADHSIYLWDAATGKELHRLLEHSDEVWSVAIAPDGKLLASGSQDGTIGLWEMPSGKPLGRIVTKHGAIRSVAFAPEGTLLASGGQDNAVCLWDVGSRTLVRRLAGHSERVTFVSFSPDGKVLASGGWDNTICLWNPKAGNLLHRLEEDLKVVVSIAFAADGKTLVAGTYGGNPLMIWDATTGKAKGKLAVADDFLSCATVAPDGRCVAAATTSGSGDTIHLWDTTTGREHHRLLGFTSAVQCLAYSPQGSHLLVGCLDGSARLIDRSTGQELICGKKAQPCAGLAEILVGTGERSAAFAPDGETLVSINQDGALSFWNTRTGTARADRRTARERVTHLAFTADGQKLVCATSGDAVQSLELSTGRETSVLGSKPKAQILAVAPDGTKVVSELGEQKIGIWPIWMEKMIRQFRVGCPSPLGFSTDGRKLAFTAEDDSIHIANLDTATEERIVASLGRSACLAFAPDGRSLAQIDAQGEIAIWELASKTQRLVLGKTEGGAPILAYAPDGRIVAVSIGNRTVRLWNPYTGLQLQEFRGFPGEACSLSFAPDSRRLAVATGDRALFLWSVLPGHEERASSVILSGEELRGLWQALSAGHASPANRAMQRLVEGHRQSVPFLQEQLRKTPAADVTRIPDFIEDLENAQYAARKAAMEALEAFGELAKPALLEVVRAKRSPEAARRAEQLLVRLSDALPPDQLQTVRAVEVLERIHSPESRRALTSLADTQSRPFLVREARASLQRMTPR
jgi:WD40 repeat protein